MIAFSSVYEGIMPPRINTNCSDTVYLHKRRNYAQLSTQYHQSWRYFRYYYLFENNLLYGSLLSAS